MSESASLTIRWASSGMVVTFASASTSGWAEGEVRDEVPVHQVEMEQIGARRLDIGDLVGEPGEVGGQQRRCDADRHWLTQTEMMSDRETGEPAGGY
jgi:hypothetical protein